MILPIFIDDWIEMIREYIVAKKTLCVTYQSFKARATPVPFALVDTCLKNIETAGFY